MNLKSILGVSQWLCLGGLLLMCSCGAESESEKENTEGKHEAPGLPVSPEVMYQRLFRHKRAAHMEAVKAVLDLEKYEKKYKMVSLLTEKIIKVLGTSKVLLMEAGFTPGDPFPTEEKTREAYAQVVENTVFFGDILLRLPDITHDILKRNKENVMVIHWAMGFSNETNIIQGPDNKMLQLVAQELGLIEKDPDYINPYKEENIMNQMAEQIADEVLSDTMANLKKKKKKDKKKGPRLSGEL